ncbi:MAG: putative Lysine-specific demethylase [Myxococcaceae bacterium]|nr:putative Lysine-specific demethylase [Myxococcaceae bacterium]
MSERFPTLASLLAPHPLQHFLDHHWEREPLHVKGDPRAPRAGLVSLDAVDALLTGRANRHPDVTLVNARDPVEADDYSDEQGLVDPVAVAKLYAAGATIIVNNLDQLVPGVRATLSRLEAELGVHAQANLYLTPGGAQGFACHFDSHDVVLVQLVGQKQWRLYDSPKGLPMRGERFDPAATKPGERTADLRLEPGDALYIPRGLMHDADAVDGGPSMHVTVGLHAFRWSEVLLEALAARAIADPELRTGLPLGALAPGADPDALRDAMRARVDRALDGLQWDLVRDRMRGQFEREHKEHLAGLLSDAVAPISAETVFARRPGASVEVAADGDAVVLTVNGRSTRWPGAVAPMLRDAVTREGGFRLADLGDDLDDKGKRTMVKRLLGEAALAVVR